VRPRCERRRPADFASDRHGLAALDRTAVPRSTHLDHDGAAIGRWRPTEPRSPRSVEGARQRADGPGAWRDALARDAALARLTGATAGAAIRSVRAHHQHAGASRPATLRMAHLAGDHAAAAATERRGGVLVGAGRPARAAVGAVALEIRARVPVAPELPRRAGGQTLPALADASRGACPRARPAVGRVDLQVEASARFGTTNARPRTRCDAPPLETGFSEPTGVCTSTAMAFIGSDVDAGDQTRAAQGALATRGLTDPSDASTDASASAPAAAAVTRVGCEVNPLATADRLVAREPHAIPCQTLAPVVAGGVA